MNTVLDGKTSYLPLNLEDRPLADIRVLDFAQFLAGPVAAMRLADMGADVIKVERPSGGDACRSLVINDQRVAEDSLLFHTFNRNKRSFAADLKSEGDLKDVRALVRSADVVIHNFRPGIMERLGLDYGSLREINTRLVYGAVSGYGPQGPWRDKPGQDLLVQALSGMAWLSGNDDDGPVPVGFPLVDIATAGNLVQGILAQLYRRERTGHGGLVEVDLTSSAIDLQIEHLTAYLNDSGVEPSRSKIANANIFGAAPYGVYRARDGHIAIAMTPLDQLGRLLELPALSQFKQDDAFRYRDRIKAHIANAVSVRSVGELLAVLEPADIWCAKVMDWAEFTHSEGFAALQPVQAVEGPEGQDVVSTRCPIRLDGCVLTSTGGAPALGADTEVLRAELAQQVAE
jgi:crotonobetainyl-CoA:carnitine CoA-transferase CaiB-like acyl-CoA transferase